MKQVLFAFAAMAAAIAFSPAALASPIGATTAINLTCSGGGVAGPGSTRLPIGGGCTPYHTGTGKTLKTYEGLSTWSRTWYQQSSLGTDDYTLKSLTTNSVNPGNPYVSAAKSGNGKFSSHAGALTYQANHGFNDSPGQTSAAVSTRTANTIPALSGGNGGGIKQIQISSTTDTFLFNGFFFGESTANTTLSYMIFGYSGNSLVYCIDANSNSCAGNLSNAWDTYTPAGSVAASSIDYTLLSLPGADASTRVTTVYIDAKATKGDYLYLDNFLVTQTPEPRSLVLFGAGFGLIGFVLFLRRRAASHPANAERR